MEFVDWVENSALGIWMLDSLWAYPIALSTHAVGMSIVVGTVVMLDLRLLGFAGNAPLAAFRNMFALTLIGVILNFLSGIALFSSDPAQFLYHPVFWIKIGLMLTGVISIYFLWRQIQRDNENSNEDFKSSPKVKILAGFSLLIWFSVIVAGRLIAYVELS